MAQIFNRAQINNDLPGLILCSHGPLAIAMCETIRMLTGEIENIAAFSLEEGQNPDTYRESIKEAMLAFPDDSLIIVDVFGGTPSNSVMMIAKELHKVPYVVAGLNVPILMQAALSRSFMHGQELLDSVMEIENGGVVSISEKLEKMISN